MKSSFQQLLEFLSVQKNKNNQSYLVETSIDFDEITRVIDKLSVDKKQKPVQRLLDQDSGLIVILDNSNIINSIAHSIAILNESSAEEIFQLLKNIPPQAIEKLIEAIALWVAQDRATC